MSYETFGLAEGVEQLVAVAAHGQITVAADHLGVPQPTLSRALARLSRDLGIPLLQREGRGVQLTRHGEMLAACARRALDELLAGIRAARADVDPDTGTAVLGFLHSLGPRVVPELVRGFRVEHPGVSVGLIQGAADDLLNRLSGGGVDLVISAPVPADRRWQVHPLARQPLILLIPRGHPLGNRRSVRMAELAGQDLITLAPGYGVRTITDQLLRASGVPLRYAFESQEMTTAAGLVAAGLGVAVLPPGNEVPGTNQLTLTDAGASRTLSLAWSAERPLSPPVAALRDYLTAHAPHLLGAGSGQENSG